MFLGGVLTEWLSWPFVFFVNVPVGLAVLALSPRWLPAGARTNGRIDVAGAATVTASLSLLVFGIVRAPDVGWTSERPAWCARQRSGRRDRARAALVKLFLTITGLLDIEDDDLAEEHAA